MAKFDEIGKQGLPEFSGFVEAAYNADLFWPAVYPLYNRIRRSDPEIAIVRTGYSSLAGKMQVDVVSPEEPTDDDKRAAEFYESELENTEGGISQLLDGLANYVPFMGWGWWEVVPGLRLQDWRPPDDDPWRSEADDGLIGVRRFAFRDHSSFASWDFDPYQRVKGMWQQPVNTTGTRQLLPLDNSLHVTFGDPYNPEGLTPLEGVWRLERIKYGLEVVFGIGSEHTAGYLEVTVDGKPDTDDKIIAQKAARAILSAQEGNFALWTDKVKGKIVDTPFAAAATMLEAIRYYGLLKLQLYNMQWVSIASTSGSGAYSAMSDASSMFMTYWNAMFKSFGKQYDDQVGARLWQWNKDKFPGATTRPRYVVRELPKTLNLQELGSFWQIVKNTMPTGDDDYIEIRKQSGFLPTELPEVEEEPEPVTVPETTEPEPTAEETIEEDTAETMPTEEAEAVEAGELSMHRPDSGGEIVRQIDRMLWQLERDAQPTQAQPQPITINLAANMPAPGQPDVVVNVPMQAPAGVVFAPIIQPSEVAINNTVNAIPGEVTVNSNVTMEHQAQAPMKIIIERDEYENMTGAQVVSDGG